MDKKTKQNKKQKKKKEYGHARKLKHRNIKKKKRSEKKNRVKEGWKGKEREGKIKDVMAWHGSRKDQGEFF